MSVLIRDLHNKYIIDFNTTNNDLVVYINYDCNFISFRNHWLVIHSASY